jgi:NAD(P)-dependent dehydrogenase (short-subunit alcohol dehydrogenase family)
MMYLDGMKNAFITGVSTGIGRCTAEYFLERGWRVFGTVRNSGDAAVLEHYGSAFVPLTMDVTDYARIEDVAFEVRRQLAGSTLHLLVNNAGIVVYGPLMYIPMERFDQQMRVNVNGYVKVTQAMLPLLGARKDFAGETGRIVNIGSVSGILATPFLGPYCASKHALEAFSDCLRRELLIFSIDVVHLQVASTHSAIWEKAREADTHMEGTPYAHLSGQKERILKEVVSDALDTEIVARRIWKIAIGKARKPRYLIARNKLLYRLYALLPDRWIDRHYKRSLRHIETARLIH